MHGQQRRRNEKYGFGDSSENRMDRTKLIINYLPQFASEVDLANIFSLAGQIESIRIMRDLQTGYSCGYGFVKYTKPEFATRAIETFNGMNFRNKRLKVSYSRPAEKYKKDSNLYITNLPKNVTENYIAQMFGEYGKIIQKSILKDNITGLSLGVAFVRYAKATEAQAAIAALDRTQLNNAMLPLRVRVAEDHGRQADYLDCMNHEGCLSNSRDLQQIVSDKLEAWKQMNLDWLYNFTESTRDVEFYEKLFDSVQHTFTLLLGFLEMPVSNHLLSYASKREKEIYRQKRNFDPYISIMEKRLEIERQKVCEEINSIDSSPLAKRMRLNT